jgi:hypothetical protein
VSLVTMVEGLPFGPTEERQETCAPDVGEPEVGECISYIPATPTPKQE